MLVLSTLLSVCMLSMISAMPDGYSNNEDWAYQWYTGEQFHFQCHTSKLNINSSHYVVWDTPTKKALPSKYNDDEFEVKDAGSVRDSELLIKNVQSHLHGVYVCKVYDVTTTDPRGHVIYGLNVHDVKYHDMLDKYRNNIIVAVVATAVFVVPLATICLVWRFQHMTSEQKAKRLQRKSGGQKYMVSERDQEMKKTAPDGLAASVMSPEGKGAYENPDLSTQL